MMTKRKRLTAAALACAFAAVAGAGLLCAFLPRQARISDETVELTEKDFEYGYVKSSLAYGGDTQETDGEGGVFGWSTADYACIQKIHNNTLDDLMGDGVTKIVINIPAEHSGVPVKFVAQDAFADCVMKIVDIKMPLSVYWQIKVEKNGRFTFDNASSFARADGNTATFTAFTPQEGNGPDGQPVSTLILPSNVWIDTDGDEKFEDGEPTYRYTEYLFKGNNSKAKYTNLVVMPDVVNIFNGAEETNNRPKMQGGLLSKSTTLQSVYFCTGRSEILHLYPLTFENCTALTEISLSAGVYLEDGARVFQGSSALEKFTIADEKTASAPLFYTVGADGALYTNNYSVSYMDQSKAQAYYEWWKTGGRDVAPAWDQALYNATFNRDYPQRFLDDWSADKSRFADETGDAAKGTLEGETTSEGAIYYAKGSSGSYNSGIGIPEGSYVFDFNNGSSSDNDFAKGSDVGNYPEAADFESHSVDARFNTTTVSWNGITLTGTSGTTVDATPRYFRSMTEGKTYTYAPQIKQARPITVNVPFEFTMTAYFVKKSGDTSASTTLGLYKNWNADKKSGTLVGERITDAPYATATVDEQPTGSDFTSVSTGLLQADRLSADTDYSIVEDGSTGLFRLLALVITPVKEKSVAKFEVEERELDAAVYHPVERHSIQLECGYKGFKFKVRALTADGEPVKNQDIEWNWQSVDGWDRSSRALSSTTAAKMEGADGEQGWWEFDIEEHYSDEVGVLVLRLTAGGHTEYLYINVVDSDYRISERHEYYSDYKEKYFYPDPDRMKVAPYDGNKEPLNVELTQERVSKYQTLVSMPAKAKDEEGNFVNSFEFGYHETVEIGPNAFQNTFISVIDIPDRIASIGASAFRFSDHLQTVYLPDSTAVGLNAFGQEADADPDAKTVFTAGKKNFFLIAPSRASYEGYLYPLSGSDPKAPDDVNYNYFPVHVESVNTEGGFQGLDGKDATYDYTPYLTYEITANFLTYGEGDERDEVQSTEVRTFLYGKDVNFVKSERTMEWAPFEKRYDNNAPVYFGHIKGNVIQQVNTIATDLAWSIAEDGWYYDEEAAFPSGNWYFGNDRVTDFTEFFAGRSSAGGYVSTATYDNYAQSHYRAIYENTRGMDAVTETDGGEGSLLEPSGEEITVNAMPFSVTFKNRPEERENTIYFNVPNFQNIGEITYGEDTYLAAPGHITPDETWNVPMLTVTFDYNGFPVSRIFEGFMSSAMKVSYEALNDHSCDPKGWYTHSGSWDDPKSEYYPEMYGKMSYNGAPYEAGYYRITVAFRSEEVGGYNYRWSGAYNGMRAESDSKGFSFILHIEPRKVSVSSAYFMQYSGEGFDLFEGNPYLRADYSDISSESRNARGLPYAVGGYGITLSLYDPKNYYGRDSGSSSDSGNVNGYTPNLQWDGDMYFENDATRNMELEVALFILDGKTPANWVGHGGGNLTFDGENVTVTEPMAAFGSEVQSYVYNGAPVSIEEAFGGTFSTDSIEYTISHNGKTVTEIKAAGDYTVTITPAAGFVWWKGNPIRGTDSGTRNEVSGWALDSFWEGKGGYEENKTATLTFHVFVEKKEVAVPSDSYVPKGILPPYTFAAPIGGDYEVVGYHAHDFASGEIPKASETSQWVTDITRAGVYDVLLCLTDPANCKWDSLAAEQHGDNYYVTARLYASFDREKEYPVFADEDHSDEVDAEAEIRQTLTLTYSGAALDLSTLFAEGAPAAAEADYSYVKLSARPTRGSDFADGEGTSTIEDAGYYGITVTLHDPFLFTGTNGTVAYYVVHMEEATVERAPSSEEFWVRDHLYRVGDEDIELKLPESPAAPGYPLTIVAPNKNTVSVTYHLETHRESDHDPDAIQQNIDDLYAGTDVFLGDWYEDSARLKVKDPGGYCVYVKVVAQNHEVYYDYISLHIFHEELTITLKGDAGGTAVYGDSVHTQEALRNAVFNAIESITVTGDGGSLDEGDHKAEFEGKKDYFFFYFMRGGREYDIGDTGDDTPSYLNVGTYDLWVRYSGPAVGSAEDTTQFIKFNWAPERPQFEITPRPLTLSLGDITGHTYLDMSETEWHSAEELSYTGAPEKEAVISRNGVKDMLTLSYTFRSETDDVFPSLNAISPAGNYTVEVASNNPNYAVTLDKTYTYTVSPRPIAAHGGGTVSYDGTERKPDVSFTGLPANIVLVEEKDYTLSYTPSAGAHLGENGLPHTAGTYTVTITLLSGNYAFAGGNTATLTFVIEGTPINMPYLSPASFQYTGEDLTATVRAALHNFIADAMAVTFYASENGTGEAIDKVIDAGGYSVKVALTDSDYSWEGGRTETVLQFSVARRTHASLALTAADIEATYGDTGDALRPTVGGLPQGFEISFLYSYEGIEGTTYAASADAPQDVGKYRVTVTAVYTGSTNDEPFTVTVTANLTIKVRMLTFSLDSAEGTGGLVGAVFTDANGNVVALASADYSFTYSFGGETVESMTAAGEYTVTVTLLGDAAKNNALSNATAVYTLTQGLSGGPSGGGGTESGPAPSDDLDVGAALLLMGVQVILIGVVFGLAKNKKKSNEGEN